MKRIVSLGAIMLLISCAVVIHEAQAGWKENYREKYSKKQLDPNSEKAKKIRRIANMDFKFNKWTRTPEERKALGLPEAKTSWGEHIKPWQRDESIAKDDARGYTTNFGPARQNIEKKEGKSNTGYSLTGLMKDCGKAFLDTKDTIKTSGEEVK